MDNRALRTPLTIALFGYRNNPPHLVPLVEIAGGAKTSEETIQRAAAFYTALGKQAVRLHKEVRGHVANRLQAALAREVYYLVDQGVVSVADVDTALSWGPGLRWGIMGQVLLNHLCGGHAEVGSRSIDDLAGERDEVLLGLQELRAKAAGVRA